MRYVLPLTSFIIVACSSMTFAQNTSVSAPVLLNTLMITTVNGQGTGFTLDVDGRQYLVTARHLVNNMGSEGNIEIAKFDQPGHTIDETYSMKIFRAEGAVDIAVLIPTVRLTIGESMSPCGFQMGQNAYFVGFPLGQYSDPQNNGLSMFPRPMGLIKQGLLSGVKSEDGGTVLILDGMNIGGFSGSPVAFWMASNGNQPERNCVIGVVSGFTANFGPVLVPRLIKEQDIRPGDYENGLIVALPEHPGKKYRLEERKVNGAKTNETVRLNTGIVRSYSLAPALKLIHDHPIGASVNNASTATMAKPATL
jgi:hypothetical protein